MSENHDSANSHGRETSLRCGLPVWLGALGDALLRCGRRFELIAENSYRVRSLIQAGNGSNDFERSGAITKCVCRKISARTRRTHNNDDFGPAVAVHVCEFHSFNRPVPWPYESDNKLVRGKLLGSSFVYPERVTPDASRLKFPFGYNEPFGGTGNLEHLNKPQITLGAIRRPGPQKNHHHKDRSFHGVTPELLRAAVEIKQNCSGSKCLSSAVFKRELVKRGEHNRPENLGSRR
jgi:hypothetical protein